MTLQGDGTFYEFTKGKVVLYIPQALVKDSQFPFAIGDHPRITIHDGKLIVEKVRKRR